MARRTQLASVPDQPGRAVLYIRVSAVMGRDDMLSPDIQLTAIRRAITPAGLREVDVIEDIDVSGRHFTRAGIDRIRQLAQAGQVDAIAVYDVSRLGRNVRESLTLLNWLADRGVTIVSASEQVDTSTPAGRLMLTNMLAIAEYRSDEIGAGWSRAIARRAEQGRHHGRPLGYQRADRRLVPDPVLGPAITEVFARYAAGEPVGEVAGYLAAVRGKAMLTGNVKKLLRNPVYRGNVVAAGELLPGQHEPLVDEPTWQAVQDRLAAEAGTPARHLAPTWSLVGLCRCPAGHHLQRQPHRRTTGRAVGLLEDRLVCGMGRGGVAGERCPGVGRPLLTRVEAEVLRQVGAYAGALRSDHTARAARKTRLATAHADRGTLARQLARARAGMTRIAREWALGQLPDEVYRATMAELRAAETSAAGELARLDVAGAAPDPDQAATAVDALLGMWPAMTVAERGRALRTLVDRVVVRAAARWREPEEDRVVVRFRW